MTAALRPIEPRDHAAVLALNADHVEVLAPMDEARLHELLGMADRADIVDADGIVAGFVLTFGPGTAYDSANYRAFTDRYGDEFYYLDRIAIATAHQRRGLASLVYDEIERTAAPYARLALEVNAVPPNAGSLAFHAARGFLEVGVLGDDTKAVSLMVKELG
ncbi:GNAT family N-acetyltransferase [Nocardioides sp.]|uniref:GNAT family N-acetyltransferase n=1 Tax=Nocardioides sp. TaxID=35761 RepID=UPI0035299CC1